MHLDAMPCSLWRSTTFSLTCCGRRKSMLTVCCHVLPLFSMFLWIHAYPSSICQRDNRKSMPGPGGAARKPHQILPGMTVLLTCSQCLFQCFHRFLGRIILAQECLKEQPKLCICIMGPPGVNRSKYCQQVAAVAVSAQ